MSIARAGLFGPSAVKPSYQAEDKREAVIRIASEALRDGTLVPASREAVHQLESAPKTFDITPPGLAGARYEGVLVLGTVYVKEQVVVPGAKPSWFRVGNWYGQAMSGDVATMARHALSKGKLTQASADERKIIEQELSRVPELYDITPRRLAGAGYKAALVGDTVYVREQVISPGAKPTWFRAGRYNG